MTDIVIGCDNAAIKYKSIIIELLENVGVNVEDIGCDSETDDTYYPFIAKKVCEKIIESGFKKKGILVCGTGIGMAIVANKFKGIRAAVCHDIYSVERSVLSNNANIMCIGERVIGSEHVKRLVNAWIGFEFTDGSSTPKINSIYTIEDENFS